MLEDNKSAVKYFKDCEYFSRRLGLDRYTIRICFQLAETFKKLADFSQASKYYEHALELSLTIKDKYQEMKAIDGLGVCYYYRGNPAVASYYHNSLDGLTKM